MNVTYTPMLEIQRAIHKLPRTPARFQKYLDTMLSADHSTVTLPPLVLMNPMGKDHVIALLDQLLCMNADDIAHDATKQASRDWPTVAGDFRIGIVVVDDRMGGWTNRYATEMHLRFPQPPKNGLARWLAEPWLSAALWSSEPVSECRVREAIRTSIHRIGYIQTNGFARTLRQMIAQEGWVLAKSGCTIPTLEDDDLEYTREVVRPLLDMEDTRTALECLFGDEASKSLGFTPQGLSPWAGLALALHDARFHVAVLHNSIPIR